MAAIAHVLVELTRLLAQAFVAGLWQGLLLVAAVSIAFRFAVGLKAAARYGIWWLAFALGVLMPLLHIPLPWHATILPFVSAARLQIGMPWGIALAALWLALSVLRGLRLLNEAVHVRRIWKRATPVAGPTEIEAALGRAPIVARLCTSEDVSTPSVIGFVSPRLLVPASLFAQLMPAELEQIVLHETEHLRRRDDWINLLQKIGLVLFPLNPALLWIDRRLNRERELACDASVVSLTHSPFGYARCLTRLAEHRLQYRGMALSLSALGRRPELVERIGHLIHPTERWSGWRARLCSAAICAVLAFVGLGMAASPRLLSFAESPRPTDPSEPAVQIANATSPRQAFKAVPVVERQAGAQPATLKPAMLSPSTHPARRKLGHRAAPRYVRARVMRPQQPRFILTAFSMEQRQPSAVLTLPLPQPVPAFAAVRFENGWLIIKL